MESKSTENRTPQEDDRINETPSLTESKSQSQPEPSKHKTMAELDEEMKQKMAGIAGDGGEAGIEFEDGKPVAMKRSVKNNMFRYI